MTPGYRPLIALAFALALPLCGEESEAFTRALIAREIGDGTSLRSLPPAENSGPELLASDFGLRENATPERNAEALVAFGFALTEKKASAAVFSKGIYRVRLEGKRPGLALENLRDLTLKGNGARLLFLDSEKKVRGSALLFLKDVHRIAVSDFTIGWDGDAQPLAVVGRIVEADAKGVRYEIVSGGRLTKELEIRGGREWDLAAGMRAPGGYPAAFKNPGEILDDRTIFFKEKPAGNPQPGMGTLLVVEARWWGTGVLLEGENDHVTFDRFRLLGTPMTAFEGPSRHLWIHHSTLAPPSAEMSKASHDGFMPRSEFYVFESNAVRGCADDVMNFQAGHLGAFLGGGVLPDGPNGLVADRLQSFVSRSEIFVGARYFLATRDFRPLGTWKSTVKKFEWQLNYHPVEGKKPTARCRMEFDDPVPDLQGTDPRELLLMREGEPVGGYLIRGNVFSNNLCHGIWAGNGPGLVEDNEFIRTGYPAIGVIMTLRWGRWFKGFYPEGLLLRGNRLENCNSALRQPADLYVGAAIDDPGRFLPVDHAAVRHVVIESNRIVGSAQAAIAAFSAKGVSILDNVIVSPGRAPLVKEALGKGSILARRVSGGRIAGNRFENEDGSTRGVEVDESKDVHMD